MLVVSQFTLYADTRKGRRPSWSAAAPGPVAQPLVDAFAAALRDAGLEVATGPVRRRHGRRAGERRAGHADPRRGGAAQDRAQIGSRGRTASQATVTSPRRHREGRSSTGHPPARRAVSTVGDPALPDAEGADRGACRAQAVVERRQERVHALAGHVAVDQRLGQPLGDVRRAARGRRAAPTGSGRPGRPASSATQAARRPTSSQVPSTSSPSGASRASIVAQAGARPRPRRTAAAR